MKSFRLAGGALAVALAASASLPLAGPARAAAPMSTTPAAGVHRMALGQFEVTALSDGTVAIPLDALLTDVKPATLAAALGRAKLAPLADTSVNAFLINTGAKLVLVDTGAGALFKAPARTGRLLDSLRNAGYAPEQVDAVLLTHIHGDHSGGLAKDGKALFPNALVYVDRRDADFWLNRDNMKRAGAGQAHGFDEAAAMLAPYVAAQRLKSFDGAGEIVAGVRALPSYGHTPGHSRYVVESGGQKLVLWGDLIHAGAVQFPYPGTTIRFDVDAKAAALQRRREMAEAARHGYWVGAAHMPFPGIGQVRAEGKGYRWLPLNYRAW